MDQTAAAAALVAEDYNDIKEEGEAERLKTKIAALRQPSLHRATHPRRSTAARAGSAASLAALTSEISTERTVVTININFKKQHQSGAGAVDPIKKQNVSSAHTSSHDDGAAEVSTVGLVGWWHASDVRLVCFSSRKLHHMSVNPE